MRPPAGTDLAREAGLGWVAYLRAGGTTPWPDWLRAQAAVAPDAAAGGELRLGEGAAQLELLRRLNAAGWRGDPAQVLQRPPPGRGRPHLALPLGLTPAGLAAPAAPSLEVLRVATGVLTDLLLRAPVPAGTTRRRRRASLRRRRRFRCIGLPVTAAALRAALVHAGWDDCDTARRSSPRPDLVLVVVGPVGDLLREAYAARVQRGSSLVWRRFVATCEQLDRLPGPAALDRQVARCVRDHPAARVRLVTSEDLLGQAARASGVPLAGAPHGDHAPPLPLDGPRADLLRRLNAVLPFHGDPGRGLLGTPALARHLAAGAAGLTGAPLLVPAAQVGWAEQRGRELADRLAGTGADALGDLDVVARVRNEGAARPSADAVLELAVALIAEGPADRGPPAATGAD